MTPGPASSQPPFLPLSTVPFKEEGRPDMDKRQQKSGTSRFVTYDLEIPRELLAFVSARRYAGWKPQHGLGAVYPALTFAGTESSGVRCSWFVTGCWLVTSR